MVNWWRVIEHRIEIQNKDRNFLEVKPFQQRVIDEKNDLDEKITKLDEFIGTDIFYKLFLSEQDRLLEQLALMQSYSEVLGERIAEFK